MAYDTFDGAPGYIEKDEIAPERKPVILPEIQVGDSAGAMTRILNDELLSEEK